jgi:hypothetical protein
LALAVDVFLVVLGLVVDFLRVAGFLAGAFLVFAADFAFTLRALRVAFFRFEAALVFAVFFPAGAFFPFADLVFADAAFRFGFCSSTNLSTVHATLTDNASLPFFTGTIVSPFAEARLRTPAASSRVDFGAAFFR